MSKSKVKLVDLNGKAFKERFKDPKNMSPQERKEMLKWICKASRKQINDFTEKFWGRFIGINRFTISIKQELLNSFPPLYHEIFLRRVARLASVAEQKGYEVKFSKWSSSKEFGWFFVREEG